MARIAGVNLPAQKHVWVGLQSIFGIGRTRSKSVCEVSGVNPATKIRDLSEPEVEKLRSAKSQNSPSKAICVVKSVFRSSD